MTDELRSALRSNTSADLLRSVAEQRGFVSMRADGDAKARAGVTSAEEVLLTLGGGAS